MAQTIPSGPASPPRSRLTWMVRRDVLVDQLALWLVSSRVARPDEELIARIGAEVTEAHELFRARGWLADPTSYHRAPPPIVEYETQPDKVRGMEFTWLSWRDEFTCWEGEPGADRYDDYESNHIARAMLVESSPDAPWLMCIHGFGMGTPRLDFRGFKAEHLAKRLGLNLAFVTLPFHGDRKPDKMALPPMPGVDLLDTVHGLAQSVWNARQVLGYLRERTDRPIGVAGVSLGAIIASTLSALDDVDMVVGLVPAVDLSSLMIDRADRFGQHGLISDELEAVARPVLSMVSATSYVPRAPVDRRFIVAGTLDRFLPASSQSFRLWEHWGRPPTKWFHGGHVSMFWASGVQQAIDDALRGAGLVGVEP